MPKKPSSPDINIPGTSLELSMQTCRVSGGINKFSMSISKLKNSLHELLSMRPVDALSIIDSHKGGFKPFSESVRSTRQSICRMLDEFEINSEDLEKEINKSKEKSNSGKIMLVKLQSGMTGCRNAIAELLDEKGVEVSRQALLSHSGLSLLSELADLNSLLETFETDNRETIKKSFKQFQSR